MEMKKLAFTDIALRPGVFNATSFIQRYCIGWITFI